MRAVLDTNVLVSAFISDGAPSIVLMLAAAGEFAVFTSLTLLDELRGVLTRPHLARRLERRGRSVQQALAAYEQLARIVAPGSVRREVPDDPDDDHVVAAAIAARADLIVSGDHHLLGLGTVAGIKVLDPVSALQMLQPRASG